MASLEQNGGVSEDMLRSVTDELVALHERCHGRKPATARARMMDQDLLACLMSNIFADVEKTMVELPQRATVQETRSTFQQAMERRFIDGVERITGQRVQIVHLVPATSARSRAFSSFFVWSHTRGPFRSARRGRQRSSARG